jgi:hypothetical protein
MARESFTITVDDREWRKLLTRVRSLDDLEARVGVVAEPSSDLADIAVSHEYGDPDRNLPERSFIRSTMATGREARATFVGKLAGRVVEGKLQPQQAMNLVGMREAAAVKAAIASGPHIPPPLKPETIAAKGSDRPLVDTGRLLNAITHVVEPR